MARHQQRLANCSVAELRELANAAMAKALYKDAIAAYKQLLKLEPKNGWQTPLAAAYLQRAKALAAKALYKEAALLWETRAELGESGDSFLYISWLIKALQFDKAVAAFNRLDPDTPDYPQLNSVFAALLLADEPTVTANLSEQSPLRQQLIPARAALRDYCQGAPSQRVRERLQSIGFRSAYRDLRQILNALLKQEDHALDDARQLLDRVSPDSPFAALATAVRAPLVRDYGWLETLKTLTPAQRDFVNARLGLDPPQTRLLQHWLRHPRASNDKDLLGFIGQHHAILDQGQARRSALAVLSRYPKERKRFEKLFGALTAFETAHIAALRAEHEDDLAALERHWIQCAELLRGDTRNPDGKLSAALVQRHIVEHLLEVRPELRRFPSPGLIENIELGLRLDPDDKSAYLLLIELHNNALNRKAYQQWVERALARFPEDNDVLQVAIVAAKRKSAYKKAAGLARQLLARDPINTQARAVLIDAHLAHARKSMINGKYHLAEKELLSVEQAQVRHQHDGRLEIMRGFLAFRQAQDAQAKHYFHLGVDHIGDRLNAGLMLWVEAQRLRLAPAAFQNYLKPLAQQAPNPSQIARFIRLLNGYLDERIAMKPALDSLSDTLKEAVKKLTDEKVIKALLESLTRAAHFQLLAHCATRALKHQPHKPLWIYYQVFGQVQGRIERVSESDFERLDSAAERAGDAKDLTTMTLIHDFLDQGMNLLPGPGGRLPTLPGAPIPPMIDPAEILEILDQIQHLPKPVRAQLLREMTDSFGEPPPEVLQLFEGSPDDDDDDNDLFDFFDPAALSPPQPFKPGKTKRRKKKKKRR